jgi:hypothetical protein
MTLGFVSFFISSEIERNRLIIQIDFTNLMVYMMSYIYNFIYNKIKYEP